MIRRRSLILTNRVDQVGIRPILDELDRLGADYLLIDAEKTPVSITVVDGVTGRLEVPEGDEFEIGPNTRALLWRAVQPPFLGSAVGRVSREVTEYAVHTEKMAWRSLLAVPALWMNQDRARRAAERDKTRQARIARQVGLDTIPTVLTNSVASFEQAVRKFKGDVAVKSPVAWHRWNPGDETGVATYTRRLKQRDALDLASAVAGAPLYVQPYIEKRHELRVTVVDQEAFACSIDSQASSVTVTDWRHYDLEHVRHDPVDLRPNIKNQLTQLVACLGLKYAAIDIIVQPCGRMRFVELNPSGHYGWIESLTGLPISRAIAEYLTGT